MTSIANELFRPVATAALARRIYQLDQSNWGIDETLERNGYLPNRAAQPVAHGRIAA